MTRPSDTANSVGQESPRRFNCVETNYSLDERVRFLVSELTARTGFPPSATLQQPSVSCRVPPANTGSRREVRARQSATMAVRGLSAGGLLALPRSHGVSWRERFLCHTSGSTQGTSSACRASVNAGVFRCHRPTGARHLPPSLAVAAVSYHWWDCHSRVCAASPHHFYRNGCSGDSILVAGLSVRRVPPPRRLTTSPRLPPHTPVAHGVGTRLGAPPLLGCTPSVGCFFLFDDGPGCCWLLSVFVTAPARL